MNTIATFNEVTGIYAEMVVGSRWRQEMERRAIIKSDRLYKLIDQSNGFYSTPITDHAIRSRMNVPFDVAGGDASLTNDFILQAWEKGIVGLRTLTPFGTGKYMRASLYNGVSVENTEILASFMEAFMNANKTK
ncbi:MAG: hypothetical protein IPI14_10095 [Polaromonas sp.]|nr:hypothetical protein [Polaromonas sp.]